MGRCGIPSGPGRAGMGHRRTPIEPEVSKSPEASNITCEAYPMGRKASSAAECQVPDRHSPVRAHGQKPAITMNRCGLIINRLTGNMRECPVFEGRIDLVPGKIVLERNDDSSLLAELRPAVACHAQHRPAQDRIPKPEPPFPAVAGQQCSCRVEGRTQAKAGRAFEGRPPDAGGSVPEIDLAIFARRRQRGAVGAPGDTLSQGRQHNRPDKLS